MTWRLEIAGVDGSQTFIGTRDECVSRARELADAHGTTVYVYGCDGYAGAVYPDSQELVT